MELLYEINDYIHGIVWGPPMLILMIGTGIYFNIITKFFSIKKLGYVMKNTLFKMFSKAQVGVGEITALVIVMSGAWKTGMEGAALTTEAFNIGLPGGLRPIWDFADSLNGLMTIPNLIALLALSPIVVKLTREFFIEEKTPPK